jgi:hypothetical protein
MQVDLLLVPRGGIAVALGEMAEEKCRKRRGEQCFLHGCRAGSGKG